ncbi:1-deoxy-D-xylulose-5-phosphate synthase [Streptomyces sp. RB5]|uniref:dihydrolipoyllysine-residue succinyltransferase n=1 Tax=Streptomyces smaragdinus TaxID=2585196 RepID=A0A7K0CBC3_9ACTN|nr:alpha-ketoacid dehydrogenase subunit alpha/beta [Streptomyces smaragdinus]MQY10739.1 1-deoxy-D-xylulose-5-phosphate synthase [Streptomyces smaragdinus]
MPEPDDRDLDALLLIRHFEQTLLRLFAEGRISGTTHTCLGQEYVPVALAPLLRDDDFVFSNHRGHGHYLALTGDAEGLLAEVMGRAGAVCGGVGGSQHVYTGRFLSTGVQGESLPVAVGAALHRQGTGAVALAFTGDGTWGEGAVYEALNMAGLWELPLVVVVENNGIAQSTPTARALSGTIRARAEAFGAAYHHSAVTDAAGLRAELAPLLALVRGGGGPLVVELDTVRLGPHSKGDDTRPAGEVEAMARRDWYGRYAAEFPERFRAADERWAKEVRRLADEVAARPPADGRAVPQAGLPAPVARPRIAVPERPERVVEHLNRALHAVLEADPSVHVLGEDIADPYPGAFAVTRGLSERFGTERVRSTPISEGAIAGAGAGLALSGSKAVVEIMFGDFVTLAVDQLVNFAAKSVTMYGRRVPLPLVVRCPVGGRRGYGPTHSQSPQKLLAGVPDLALYELTPCHDAGELLFHALESGTPSVLFEDKILYTTRRWTGGTVDDVFRYRITAEPDGGPGIAVVEPAGGGEPDAVLIVPGGLAHRAVEAARELLLEDELWVRVLVPARLWPVPGEELAALCGGAPAVVVAEDGTPGASWGTEVAHGLHTRLWRSLRGPVDVLCAADGVIPAAPGLEEDVFVSAGDIRRAVAERMAADRQEARI